MYEIFFDCETENILHFSSWYFPSKSTEYWDYYQNSVWTKIEPKNPL